MDISVGLLNLTKRDFRELRPKEIFIKLKAHIDREIKRESELRTICYHILWTGWDKKTNGPLTLDRVWEIPEIDSKKEKKLATWRFLKPGEKPFQNR